MIKQLLFCAAACIGPILPGFTDVKSRQENHPPVVKLLAPRPNSTFDQNASVTFKISVSDQEDGASEFDEINAREVLLEVRHLRNKKIGKADQSGLALMMASNCANCHNFKSAGAMGPSFYQIASRYTPTRSSTDSLAARIVRGSTGIWSKEKMPAHTELSAGESRLIAAWILKYAADPDLNYYVGTEGYFRFKPADDGGGKGSYLLTASYTDHGMNQGHQNRLRGQDAVTIHCR